MWVKQGCKPPRSGNGNHTTYKNGDLGDEIPSSKLRIYYGTWPMKFVDLAIKDGDFP